MTRERASIRWLRRGAIGALTVLALLLASWVVPAAEDEVRSLLRGLWIQTPSRQVSAPPFSLPDLSDKTVRLADERGRPVMLYFWTTY